MSDRSRWGQQQVLGPHWVENQPKVLLKLATQEPLPQEALASMRARGVAEQYCPPTLQPMTLNVALSAQVKSTVPPAVSSAGFFWQILIGAGGGSRTVFVDARPFQQLSVTASAIEISMVARQVFTDLGYQDPAQPVDAAALVSIGNTSTFQATHTVMRHALGVGGANAWTVPVPDGASTYRLLGTTALINAVNTPFLATVDLTWSKTGFIYSESSGRDMGPFEFWAIPGGANTLVITNGSAATINDVGIQFGLDL